jgi:hypothetical protein
VLALELVHLLKQVLVFVHLLKLPLALVLVHLLKLVQELVR